MSRPHRARGMLLVVLLLAAGCQDYNFNPVGHCLIQPGTRRVTLSNVSSADVLFVVDDSGSMGGEQASLAANFDRFIGNLDAANEARRTAGLEPFDFHIAVTSTSMSWNYQSDGRPQGPYTCTAGCGGAAGTVCCTTANTPARMAKACTTSAECSAGTTCGTNCISPYAGEARLTGQSYCCVQGATDRVAAYPAGYVWDTIPCSRTGTACGTFETHYNFAGCGAPIGGTNGVARDGWPYPQGDFVSWTSGETANPRVLHFDKELYPEVANPSATNRQGFTRQQLMDFFSGGGTVGGNVIVGVCGSGEEQALGAARAAIEKARDGRQKDTYERTGTGTPLTPVKRWTGTTRLAGADADWLAPGVASKLVVVFVGDEDDCSPTASDPSGTVVWDIDDDGAGVDSCSFDASRAPPLGGKLHTVDAFADFFTGLGREVAAAFILPAAQTQCTLQTCTSDALCGGAVSRGIRLLDTARELSARGVDVVAGSICDGNFGSLLDSIAEIVKPPSGLTLPSLPADGEVTLLRIVAAGGQTRKVCTGPLEGSYTLAAAQATGADWWFTASADPGPPAAGVTQNVYINQSGSCLANPGETYSADYLGQLPAGGCRSHAQCRTELGGSLIQLQDGSTEEPWTCFAGVAGDPAQCVDPATSPQPGSCLCGPPSKNCPPSP